MLAVVHVVILHIGCQSLLHSVILMLLPSTRCQVASPVVGATAAIKHTDATKWPVSHCRGYSYGGVIAFVGKHLEVMGDKVKLTIRSTSLPTSPTVCMRSTGQAGC